MQTKPPLSLNILLWITIANYLAQIPYYLHNYYFSYHLPPTTSSLILLGLTLAWFVTGYIGLWKTYRFGYPVLLSFLIVEALFYLSTIIFGAFIFQLQNPSLIIKAVFLMGYLSGFTAAYYAYALIRSRGSLTTH